MDVMTEEVREAVPWNMLFADDIVVCAEGRDELEAKLERWRTALESRGIRISRPKTVYMCSGVEKDGRESIRLDGEEIKRVDKFKYLGSVMDKGGDMDKEVQHRIQAGWNNWRIASGSCVIDQCL